MRLAIRAYGRVLDRVEAAGYDVLGAARRAARLGPAADRARGGAAVTRRATLRGAERTPLDERADVLICGASFAGLAIARELAGSGADVLVVDRYAIGERATSACAAPTPWLRAMGVERAIRQELPYMAFHTPHGSARFRLPWSWSSFDYRELCLASGSSAMRASRWPRSSAAAATSSTPTAGPLRAPLIVDALGWRRVLGPGANVQPPEALLSRGLEVHPHDARGVDLDVWVDRSAGPLRLRLVGPGGGRAAHRRRLLRPAPPRQGADRAMAERLETPAVRYQGNWFPHELRPAAEDGVFFAGDTAGHCIPLSGEGIRTAFYFGIACGRELRAVHARREAARAGARRLRRLLGVARAGVPARAAAPAPDPGAPAAGADRAAARSWAASGSSTARSAGTSIRRIRVRRRSARWSSCRIPD